MTPGWNTLTPSRKWLAIAGSGSREYVNGGTLNFSSATPCRRCRRGSLVKPPSWATSEARAPSLFGSGSSLSVVSSHQWQPGGQGEYDIGGATVPGAEVWLHQAHIELTGGLASSGTLNISGGGTVEVHDGNFIIGDRDATGAQGVGTINQSGGTFIIDGSTGPEQGRLWRAMANGNTYNWWRHGGKTLNDLAWHWLDEESGLDLGGGTIEVIGSDLTTDVSPTLVNNTTSFINTNGFNATFSGAITGRAACQDRRRTLNSTT